MLSTEQLLLHIYLAEHKLQPIQKKKKEKRQKDQNLISD